MVETSEKGPYAIPAILLTRLALDRSLLGRGLGRACSCGKAKRTRAACRCGP